jgi:hypothetical protein
MGDAVRHPDFVEEAQLVCDEMATRARQNIEVIIERLTADGYRFHSDDPAVAERPHYPPTANAAEHVAWLQERCGVVPMTLSSWIRLVGDVWLVGTHPQWSTSAQADPLVIDAEGSRHHEWRPSFRDHLDDEWNTWREGYRHPHTDQFVFDFAPDKFFKANYSGGASYGMVMPDGCADGLFAWEESVTPFVSYLTTVFRCGGFPDFRRRSSDTGRGNRYVTRALAKDLLPL